MKQLFIKEMDIVRTLTGESYKRALIFGLVAEMAIFAFGLALQYCIVSIEAYGASFELILMELYSLASVVTSASLMVSAVAVFLKDSPDLD